MFQHVESSWREIFSRNQKAIPPDSVWTAHLVANQKLAGIAVTLS
jgi:hypothetical protein